MKATEVAILFNLKPNPEGGIFSETFRDSSITLSKSQLPPQYKVDRPISTCIYYLLSSGSVSHLHRIPCAETWHFYKGEPLTVFELGDNGDIKQTILGPDIKAGHKLQYTVPPYVWFGSYPTMDIETSSTNGKSLVKAPTRNSETHYSLVGCTCAPAFQFQDFELAKRSELIASTPGAEAFITYLTNPEATGKGPRAVFTTRWPQIYQHGRCCTDLTLAEAHRNEHLATSLKSFCHELKGKEPQSDRKRKKASKKDNKATPTVLHIS